MKPPAQRRPDRRPARGTVRRGAKSPADEYACDEASLRCGFTGTVDPTWVAGGARGSEPGFEFDEPNELGFDHNGNIWAGDVYNLRVQVYDINGVFITALGGSGSAPGEFVHPADGKYGPEAIRADSTNRVFVIDRGGQRVNVYDGYDFSTIGSFQSPDVILDDPTGLANDTRQSLYRGPGIE